jgi:hypothetical protein
MMILAPSWKRADICTSHKYFPSLKYVVCKSQEKSYLDKGLPVLACQDKDQGNVSRVRNWILDYAKKENVCIVDDDLKCLSRWNGNECHKMSGDEAEEFIEYGFMLAEQFGVKMWGVNIIQDKGAYREYTPFSLTNVILGPFGGFLNPSCRYDENLPLKEDYDLSLQMLNKYRKILRINHVHYICEQHTNIGGCAEYRTLDEEKDQFELLEKKWGKDIVRRDKGNSNTQRKRQVTYDINPIIKIPIGGV